MDMRNAYLFEIFHLALKNFSGKKRGVKLQPDETQWSYFVKSSNSRVASDDESCLRYRNQQV